MYPALAMSRTVRFAIAWGLLISPGCVALPEPAKPVNVDISAQRKQIETAKDLFEVAEIIGAWTHRQTSSEDWRRDIAAQLVEAKRTDAARRMMGGSPWQTDNAAVYYSIDVWVAIADQFLALKRDADASQALQKAIALGGGIGWGKAASWDLRFEWATGRLLEIGRRVCDWKDVGAAAAIWETLLERAGDQPTSGWENETFASLVHSCASPAVGARALAALDQEATDARQSDDLVYRARGLAGAALGNVHAHRIALGRKLATEAFPIARQISERVARAEVLTLLGEAELRAGGVANGLKRLREAIDTLVAESDDNHTTDVLAIAALLGKLKQLPAQREALSAADRLRRRDDGDHRRPANAIELAAVYVKLGDNKTARALLEDVASEPRGAKAAGARLLVALGDIDRAAALADQGRCDEMAELVAVVVHAVARLGGPGRAEALVDRALACTFADDNSTFLSLSAHDGLASVASAMSLAGLSLRPGQRKTIVERLEAEAAREVAAR